MRPASFAPALALAALLGAAPARPDEGFAAPAGLLQGLEASYVVQDEGVLSAHAVFGLRETDSGLLYAQLSATLAGDEAGGSAGVGWRWQLRGALLGVNAFWDYADREDEGGALSRGSLGAEFKSRYTDLSANLYQGAGAETKLRSADGWDVEAAGRLPRLDDFEFATGYHRYRSPGRLVKRGFSHRLEYALSERLRLQLFYDGPDQQEGWGAGLSYRFSLDPDAGAAGARPNGWERRYEKAPRSYRIVAIADDADPGGGRIRFEPDALRIAPNATASFTIEIDPAPAVPLRLTVSIAPANMSGWEFGMGSNCFPPRPTSECVVKLLQGEDSYAFSVRALPGATAGSYTLGIAPVDGYPGTNTLQLTIAP